MERTPSPPRRIHTPPAPLHGDTYEPFSPRRSSRVAAQRDIHSHQQERSTPRTRRDITPTASSSKRSAARANASFALSPPSSPVTSQQPRSPRSIRRAPLDLNPLDSDSDNAAPTSSRRTLFANMAPGMLPTPAKTPRKRRVEDVSSTARVLFPTNRPSTIEEAMPTPRKGRKTKNLYTLESFAEQMDETTEKIPIFTDSKERVPTPGAQTEENPFITVKGKGKAKATPQKSRKLVDRKTAKMEAAADRDEGMVYIFRGRKVFRKFHDDAPSGASDAEQDDELSADDKQVRRQIGVEARRPLTRSSIKPKLLFQAEIKERNRAQGIETDDEEATTEVDEAVATPSRRKGKSVVPTPSLATTPPPTTRKLKKEISFDSWSRVKSAHSSSSSVKTSKKRSGEPLEREAADKRARSEHSTSSMSFGSI
ncbi:hypothetical protein CC77DRAFT_1098539 [Alternaria alternata]|uniref:Uncharacterized protein n=3 Tax=Alternaria sect. Alternaria TaxID=2499237 RepID=A0A177D9K8_ALTAL|nr:hypothetical protein CC77DRAFT_1098539 [Alternaria alternata]XP_051585281.1 uncharacterized protein J4E82_008774 [Alternaria postmessia]RII11020.1 hypothetical protein CUC08_Gglean007022 [Alternaria sp. MG1]RYN47731.1 hypothetical protein AA0114_g7612 [Alternaria tenuissima]RYO67510.1 hypothetical protein AA0113_g4624 [Alternaria arborescens]KAI5372578.1 hypothetical protein J4E82_008774 [Alternaria postmessia]OAG16413.1 hypothetical protein CC77DRAFT_1098539 [Alternaria alternata]